MAQIIGGLYTAPDTFAFMKNPDMQWYDIQEFDKLVAQGLTKSEYWSARDKYWSQSLRNIEQGFRPLEMPSFFIDDPSTNLYQNSQAWNRLNDAITKREGRRILAFDTETIGDFMHGTNSSIESRIAGITEISFSEQKMLRNGLEEIGPTGSFVFGIDQDQSKWLREVLEKKKNGMALTDVESSGLERASRYSTIEHNGHVFNTRVGEWRGSQYTFANSLNISNPNSIADIESGIAALEKLYSSDRESKISSIIDYINEAELNGIPSGKGNRTVPYAILGQNLQYDIGVIDQYSSLRGTSRLHDGFQYADSLYALRAYANANNTTVAELIKNYNSSVTNSRLGSLEAMIESIRGTDYTKYAAHNAYEDSLATIEVFMNKHFDINSKAQEVLQNVSNTPNEVSLADSIIKINKKGNIRSNDFLLVNGQITGQYSPSNMYWNIVGVGNTTFDALEIEHPVTKKPVQLKGSQDKFVVQFESAIGDGATLFKTFDTADDFQTWLRYNTTIRSKQDVSVADIAYQQTIHDKDIARRVIDGFFDPGSVSQYGNNTVYEGGFNSFKKYYSAYEDLARLSDDVVSGLGLVDINGKNITTARGLLNNIGVGENIIAVLDYADQNNLTSITNIFRTTKTEQGLSAIQATTKKYNTRTTMQEVFGMFQNNPEFFSTANDILTSLEINTEGSNLQKTIAFQDMRKAYLSSDAVSVARDIGYTIDDINLVSIATENGRFSNIDVSDIKRGSSQLQRAFIGNGLTEGAVSSSLFRVVDDLESKGLIDPKRATSIKTAYNMRNNSYGLANSIVTALNNETEDIRALGIDAYRDIKTRLDAGETIESLGSVYDEKIVKKISVKNHRSLSESAISEMSRATGSLTPEVAESMRTSALSVSKASIIKGAMDNNNEQAKMIRTSLEEMNYASEDIEQFLKMFYSNGKGKSNISEFNRTVAQSGIGEQIKPVFYKSGGSKTSDFLFITREKDYARLIATLNSIDENATGRQIKESIDGLASYFEIPYLERINLEDVNAKTEADKIVRKLNGDKHGIQAVMVRQGDNDFYVYDNMALNIYKGSNGVYHGRIQDSGGNYLTSIRQRALSAFNSASEGNYSSATRLFNDPNKARMSEAASPQFGGVPDGKGGIKKLHMFSQKDMDFAHAISLESEASMSLIDLMEILRSDHIESGVKTVQNGYRNNQGINAIRQLYDAFNEEFNLAGYEKDELKASKRVFESEPFRIFSSEYMTAQSGGIGQDKFIAEYIKRNPQKANALFEMRDKSLLQIMAEAVKENEFIDKDLATTIDILANEMNLDSIASESFAHKNMMFFGGYHIVNNNNSRTSGQYRPTYAQRSNYRPFTLEEGFFRDVDSLSENLGIHFGDVYTSKNYMDFITRLDKYRTATTGETLNRTTASYRNIIGAVQSISDAEIQSSRNSGLYTQLLKDIAKERGLTNKSALDKIYTRMIGDLNTYEGKFYVRPSLANENFFIMGDPKSYKNSDIQRIFATGTEAEKRATASQLKGLEGQTVKNGTIIGFKQNPDGSLKPLTYNGPTIAKFDRQYALDLMEFGKTDIETKRQLADVKLFIGEEKGTAETLSYFSSVNPDQQMEEIKQVMHEFGLDYKTTLSENIEELNRYTDAVYDVFTHANTSKHKTTVIFNNNVNKHLTDMAIDTKWNLIMSEFNSQEGLDALKGIGKNVFFADGSTLSSHLSWDILHDSLLFDNPTDKGSINALDQLIKQLRTEDGSMAKSAIVELDKFAQFNGGFQSIQRQYMNTFMGQSFKMDQRVYQTLVMQADGNYMKGNGAKLAETIRSRISSGWYDKNVSYVLGGNNIIDNTWSNIVHDRRGFLRPKGQEDMLIGILESFEFLETPNKFANANIITLDAKEIIGQIPRNGGNYEAYQNFIFKVDGKLSSYLESRAIAGTNNAFTGTNMNVLKIDLSEYGKFKYKAGQIERDLDSILIPIQHINTSDEQIFVSESTKNTIAFFNALESYNRGDKSKEEIEIAIQDLFKSYARELDTSDKDSLVSKVNYKMKMPNSSGLLALDALSPTIDMDYTDIEKMLRLENEIAVSLENGIFDEKKIEALKKQYQLKSIKVAEQIANIDKAIESDADIVNYLKMTGKREYKDYLRSYDSNGRLITNSIDSAIVVGKEMFERTEMDTGRIGYQLFNDYFSGNTIGLKNYEKIQHAIGKGSTNREFKIDFNETMKYFFDTFEDTDHKEWADRTRRAIDTIMSGQDFKVGKKVYSNGVFGATSYLNDSIARYMRDDLKTIALNAPMDFVSLESYEKGLTEEAQKQFLLKVQEGFESVGNRYAKNVGILGITNRYPNFSQAGVLPVRIYLDESIQGNEVRFLGPQFSILQNLDFDGDTEFLSFLGNGGLLKTSDDQYKYLLNQFEYMNKKNVNIFKQSLESLDSFKAYRIGDETAFKAKLLSELDPERYSIAESNFLSVLNKKDAEIVKQIKEENGELYDFLIQHSKQIKEQFVSFDEELGSSITNQQMVKAAMQARVAKEYIGNFSKPNLNIRDSMSYMLSVVEEGSQEETKLLNIKEALLSLDPNEYSSTTSPGGLLTLLEQKGIDTKHVHDADILNNSSAWRKGVINLFANPKAQKPIQDVNIISDLVAGSRKVFQFSNENDFEVANEILNQTFDEWREALAKSGSKPSEEILGKIYIRGLYEMSKMDNAYEGFFGTFKKASLDTIQDFVQSLTDEQIDKITHGGMIDLSGLSIDNLVQSQLFQDYAKYRTDERLNVFGRALSDSDIIAYQTAEGPEGFVFRGIDKKKNGLIYASFEGYDFTTGKTTGNMSTIEGYSIRDLNEAIKSNPRTKSFEDHLLDYTREDYPEKNINLRYIDNVSDDIAKNTVRRRIAELSIEDKLQTLFESVNDQEFKTIFNNSIQHGMQIPSYSPLGLGNIMAGIVGTDADAFIEKVNKLEEYLQFGLDNGYISTKGIHYDSAKDLMRQINKDIAKNPPKTKSEIVSRLQGDSARELVANYTEGYADIHIRGDKWLTTNLDLVNKSNEITEIISEAQSNQLRKINEIGQQFYNKYLENITDDELSKYFNSTTKTAFEAEIDDANQTIFRALESITSVGGDAREEMMRQFGWDQLAVTYKTPFLIPSENGIIIGDAKVGYGRFIGQDIAGLSQHQSELVLSELEQAIKTDGLSDLEKLAIQNTDTLVRMQKYSPTENIPYLDFTNEHTLKDTAKIIFAETEEAKESATRAAQESLHQSAEENIQKKTLRSAVAESLHNMTPENKTLLKIGAAAVGGAAILGLAGHALFNSPSSDVEIPNSVENEIGNGKGSIPRRTNKVALSHKNGNEYKGSGEAKEMKKQKIAPPSLLKNKTIYHDARSGFNFKVSAQSYNKLQAESYARMASQAGSSNVTLNTSRDNSKITDNWLQNKFAELTE